MAQVDILIKTDGSEATNKELDSSVGNGALSATSSTQLKPNGSGGKGSTARSVFAMQLVNAGIQAGQATFNYYKNNYGNLTGDYLGQKKIDNVFSIASDTLSFGSTIASGAVSGSAFGPVGAAVGAAVGAVVGGVNLGINYATSTASQNVRISKANAAANYNSQRIGSILTNGNR